MRVSVKWLNEFVNIDLPVDELARVMTQLGMEVESIHRPGEGLSGIVVGQVLDVQPHPNADKLVVCKTDVGGPEPLQIVCGAKNFSVGDKVPTAVVGATLPGDFKITARKMRGEESQGMMCSARELGLGDDHEGLMILPPDFPIGADATTLLGLDDSIIEIEVTPNRGDWAGIIGIARELAAYFDKEFELEKPDIESAEFRSSDVASVRIDAPDLCPRYCGQVLRNVTIAPSPPWMVQRLIAAGQRPINNIVDITNYVLLETGHPLHAFDLQKLTDSAVVIRRASAGEQITTIDDVTHTLDEQTLVIADSGQPVAVAGVMGGLDSEVTASTREIFLESAYFEPKSIRRTARVLKMTTEASQRFQRGADPDMLEYAMHRAAQLMRTIAGAEVGEGFFDENPVPFKPTEVSLRFRRTGQLLGIEISAQRQTEILERLGFVHVQESEGTARFSVPSWRHDVTIEADLIEEIARFHGYANVPAAIPRVRRTEVVLAPEDHRLRQLRQQLVGLGLTQFISLSFISESDLTLGCSDPESERIVRLENPLSEKMAIMRPALMPGLITATARNIRHGNNTVRAFELGNVFKDSNDRTELPAQSQHLAIILTGLANPAHWSVDDRYVDFHDLKGILEAVFDFLYMGDKLDVTFTETQDKPFLLGKAGDIFINEVRIGSLGQIDPRHMGSNAVDQPIFAAEIAIDTMLRRAGETAIFQAIPPYPSTYRDIAVLVDRDLPAESLLETARQSGGTHLQCAELIDVYWGEPIPEGKKSIAIRLTFQSQERTLTDQDTDKNWTRIVRKLEGSFGAQLR